MGGICPCPKRKKESAPYDVNQETFEIEENIASPALKSEGMNVFQTLNEEPPQSQDMLDKEQQPEKQQMISEEQLKETQPSVIALEQPEQKQEPKKKPVPPVQKKKLTIDDLRFLKQSDCFKIKKIDTLERQQFNIDGCNNGSFFIFDISANLYVDQCEDCFIFCAPCESSIFLRDSKGLKVFAATNQFRVRDCHDCQISLYCSSQPVIQSSSNIEFSSFAPLGYPELLDQFKKARLDIWNNHWSEIHDFTKKAGEVHYTLKNKPSYEIEWAKGLAEAEMSQSDGVVPLTTGLMEIEQGHNVICIVSHQYMQKNQTTLLAKFMSQKIVAVRIYKGKIVSEVYKQVQDTFPTQKPNQQALCLLLREESEALKKFESLGLQQYQDYMKFDDSSTVTRLSPLIFVDFKDQR